MICHRNNLTGQEGYGRFHHLDNVKFCSNSRGSCWEVLDHLITASDETLLPWALIEKGKILPGGSEITEWIHELFKTRRFKP